MDRSVTKEEALENASLAAELYMKATRSASSDSEKARLRNKCIQLLSKAEDIKKSAQWLPKPALLKAPASERKISKREEIILLEGSKLHGFIFPPWNSDPDDSVFDELVKGTEFYTFVVLSLYNMVTDQGNSEPTELELSDAQREIFGGWRRPHESSRSDDKTPKSNSELSDYLMDPVEPLDLVQDITTDCSVVASLCAGTARTSKGHGRVCETTSLLSIFVN